MTIADVSVASSTWLLGKFLDLLPGTLIKWAFKPERIAEKIEMRLRGEQPIEVTGSNAPLPKIDIYFDFINHSDFDLTLDRLLIEIWFGQPTLSGALLTRYPLPKHKTKSGIQYSSHLTEAQKSQIEQFTKNTGLSGQIHLYTTAYLDSKIGLVELKGHIERRAL